MSTSSTERMRRLRQRRAEALQANPDAHLRPVDDLLYPAVAASVEALDLGPEDRGAVQVALRLAKVIDAARDEAAALRWLGPILADALTALNATPASRARRERPN